MLRLIARGHSNRQIARDLAIGEQTVKTYVRSILTNSACKTASRRRSSPSATKPIATSTGRPSGTAMPAGWPCP